MRMKTSLLKKGIGIEVWHLRTYEKGATRGGGHHTNRWHIDISRPTAKREVFHHILSSSLLYCPPGSIERERLW